MQTRVSLFTNIFVEGHLKRSKGWSHFLMDMRGCTVAGRSHIMLHNKAPKQTLQEKPWCGAAGIVRPSPICHPASQKFLHSLPGIAATLCCEDEQSNKKWQWGPATWVSVCLGGLGQTSSNAVEYAR